MKLPKTSFFLIILTALGLIIFSLSCFLHPQLEDIYDNIDPLSFLLFFMINVVAEKNFINLDYGSTVSASFAIILAAMFLFEPPAAALMAFSGIIITGGLLRNHRWKSTFFLAAQYLIIYGLAGIAMVYYFHYMPRLFDDELYRFMLIGGLATMIYLFVNIILTNTYIALLNPLKSNVKSGLRRIFSFKSDKLKIVQTLFLFPMAVIIAYSYNIVDNPLVPLILAVMCIGSVRFVDQHQRISRQSDKMLALYTISQRMSKIVFQDAGLEMSNADFFEKLLTETSISTQKLIPNNRTIIYNVEFSENKYEFSPLISTPNIEREEMELQDDDQLLTKTVQNRSEIHLNNLSQYPEINEQWRKNYRSLIAFPIASGPEISYIAVMFREYGVSFNDQDMNFANLLRNSVALNLKNMELRQKLHDQAIRDGLLGIYNRRYLIDKFEEELKRAQRYNRPLSTLILDVDYFKAFNDTHGHVMGDQVLKDVTEIIRNAVRYTDIPARYGGDEFFIILPETDIEGAESVAHKIHKKVDEHSFKGQNNQEVSLSLSIGVTGIKRLREDEPKETASEVITRADEALYEAKRNGRNQVQTITPEEN